MAVPRFLFIISVPGALLRAEVQTPLKYKTKKSSMPQ